MTVGGVATAERAKVALDMGETTEFGQVKAAEDLGWIAMDTGTYTIESSIGAVTLAASRSTRSVKGWGTGADVSFGASLGASPLVISSQNSRFGADGGWARITAVWKGRAHVLATSLRVELWAEAWLIARGVTWDARLRLQRDDLTGWGLSCTRRIERNEKALIQVPRSAALTSSARIDALGRSVMELLRGKLDDLAG
eukprot:g1609.t1